MVSPVKDLRPCWQPLAVSPDHLSCVSSPDGVHCTTFTLPVGKTPLPEEWGSILHSLSRDRSQMVPGLPLR